LPWPIVWDWLADEVRKAALADLLDEPYPATAATKADALRKRGRSDDSPSCLRSRSRGAGTALPKPPDLDDPLLVLVKRERHAELAARCRRVLELATPAQFPLLVLVAQGISLPEAARARGIAPTTARVQMHRLRDKLRRAA
jgi:DNA-binding CsgD family transcriptional regulator